MSKQSSGGRRGLRALMFTLLLLSAGFVWLIRSAYEAPSSGQELRLDQVYRLADAGEVRSVRLLDEDALVVGVRCVSPAGPAQSQAVEPPPVVGQTPAGGPPTPCSGRLAAFHASYPRSDVSTQQLIERIISQGGQVTVDKQTGTAVAKLVATFVFPLLLLANLFGLIFLSRGGDSSIADIAGFGRITRKHERKRRSATGVSFADVAGAEEAVAELREVTDYLTDPEKFQAYGAAAPKGVLLFGQPGCGKTLLARAVAGESGVPFFSISGAEFVESLVGVGAARVRDLFAKVRAVAPAIVFIDEIDAVGRRRGGEGSSGGEREQTVNQLLVEMDGFEVSAGIVVMGATNRPDILDPALLRPGRFDRHVTVEPPEVHGRQAILELHARSKPIGDDVDFEQLARRTAGFTGADLANVINEGALLAIREGKGTRVNASHLSEAVLRVLHGPQRRGRLMSAGERSRIAVHEAGHAVVAAALGQATEVQRVSIVARGRGLGQTGPSEQAERVLLTRTEMESQLAVALSGVAAEELVFDEPSTTAEHDIDKATLLAREMIGRYGMSSAVGRLRLLSREDGYLGGDGPMLDSVSGPTMAEFDVEVKRTIGAAERGATMLLTRHRRYLDAMVEALEEEETLEGRTLEALLAPVRPTPRADGSPPSDTPAPNGRARTSARARGRSG